MLGHNRLSSSNPNIGIEAPAKVKALLDFGEEQLTWVHPDNLTSAAIIAQMKDSTYRHENRPKGLGIGRNECQSWWAKQVRYVRAPAPYDAR